MKQILRYIPFVVPFQQRVLVFYDELEQEKAVFQVNPFSHSTRARIRRDYVFEDGYASLADVGIKMHFKIFTLTFFFTAPE